MIGVNVLPESYVFSRNRFARVRRWLVAVLVVGLAFAFPVGFDAFKSAQASSLQRESDPLRIRLSDTKKRLTESLASVTDLRQQLARADALRSKRPWKDLLATLTRKVPEEVWLTSLESVRNLENGRSARHALKPTPPADRESVELNGPSGLRLTGYALGHDHLYAFMGTLNDGELFAHVELVKAGQEKVHDGSAIRFVLECQW